MIKRSCLFTFFVVVLAQIAIAQQNPPEKKVLIDIENLNGGTVSEIFAENEYIPLEDTKESQINRIEKVESTKDRYIIHDDKKPGRIFIFDKQGKFIKKITEIPGKKMLDEGFREMWVDHERKEIIAEAFWYKDGNYNVFFDLDGKYLRMEKQTGNIYFGNKINAGVDNYMYDVKDTAKVKHRVTFYDGDKPLSKYVEADTNIRASGMDHNLMSWSGIDVNNNSVLFVESKDYNIRNVGVNGVKEVYKVLFPLKNSLPLDFWTNSTYVGKRFPIVNGNPDLVFGLQNLYKINNWLFFSAMHWNGGWNRVMYNLSTATALEMRNIQGDATNGYLPVTGLGLVGTDKENVYAVLSSAVVFQAKEEIAGKNPVYSTLMQEYFKTSSRLGNPVLIRLKLKSDF
ncbi:6-bladed beta-propeller [Pedobacter frigoris]|uniref:6-bladed beta-propeller n=1 Tax=Pedobacter frigoris TaxID=2571272 RepID=A0A4V5NZM7_9SPHI|nr:6-bladed beta-propeller [Pedobacter frigoris]TKC09162.1 6-bladed beta-propeller [Pedobacter frigoris]